MSSFKYTSSWNSSSNDVINVSKGSTNTWLKLKTFKSWTMKQVLFGFICCFSAIFVLMEQLETSFPFFSIFSFSDFFVVVVVGRSFLYRPVCSIHYVDNVCELSRYSIAPNWTTKFGLWINTTICPYKITAVYLFSLLRCVVELRTCVFSNLTNHSFPMPAAL